MAPPPPDLESRGTPPAPGIPGGESWVSSKALLRGALVSERRASVVVRGGAHRLLSGPRPVRVKGLRGSFSFESLDSTAMAK